MNWKPIINAGIGIFILMLLLAYCGEHKRAVLAERNLNAADAQLVTQNALKDSIMLYVKDSLVGKMYESELRLVSEKSAGVLLKDSLKRYKKLLAVAKLQLSWHDTDTTFTHYTDTVYTPSPCDTLGFMRVPRLFDYSHDGLTFGARVERDGVSVFNKHLSIGELTIVAGWKRSGLFGWGKGIPTFDITTNNSDVYITGVKNAVVKPQPRAWYDSRGAWATYGFGAKMVLNIVLSSLTGKPVYW